MKKLKTTLLVILVLLAAGIILRGPLYRNIVAYKTTGQRINYEITNDKLAQYIEDNCAEKDSVHIKEIIKTS